MLAFLRTYPGKVLVSVLWGLALAMFFKKTCAGRSCRVIKGPPLAEVRDRVYSFGEPGSCYRFSPEPSSCGGKSTVPI